MKKEFNKDSLRVGDKVKTALNSTYTVLEVFNNTFVVDSSGEGVMFTFERAIEEGWTILPNEEDKEPLTAKALHDFIEMACRTTETPSMIGIIMDKAHQDIINQSIIKNNNELIEEIRNFRNNFRFGDDEGLYKAITIIQSKNDSLSKE